MKVILEIERPNGIVELVDVSARHPLGMSRQLMEAAREATQQAGRGYIRRIVEGEIEQNPEGAKQINRGRCGDVQQLNHDRLMGRDGE